MHGQSRAAGLTGNGRRAAFPNRLQARKLSPLTERAIAAIRQGVTILRSLAKHQGHYPAHRTASFF